MNSLPSPVKPSQELANKERREEIVQSLLSRVHYTMTPRVVKRLRQIVSYLDENISTSERCHSGREIVCAINAPMDADFFTAMGILVEYASDAAHLGNFKTAWYQPHLSRAGDRS